MSRYQLPSQEQKARYVHQQFDQIAPIYDRFNDWLTLGIHRYWKYMLVKKCLPAQDATCLDLCCGTGDVAFSLSQHFSKVYALDFSAQMLWHANQRKATNQQICWLQGDALQLPFADQTFDVVTVSYGLRNFANLQTGLYEILRVLKPHGTFVSLETGQVTWPLFKQVAHVVFFTFAPLLGKLLGSKNEAFRYLPHSAKDFPPPKKVSALLNQMGLCQVKVQKFWFGAGVIHWGKKQSTKSQHS